MKNVSLAILFLLAVGFVTAIGCGDGGNTVVEHSREAPTAEEMAEYEAEMEEMDAER